MELGDAVVGAIHRVARHGMLNGRHVDTDLMGAARLEAAFQQGEAAEALQHLIAGVGILGVGLAGRVDRHLLAVGLGAAQICLHEALVLRKTAVDDGLIGAFHAVDRHLLGQADVGGVIFRHHQQAAGVLVDAVDDAGAYLTADAREAALAVPEQGVHQRAVRIARGRVDDHALGLVHHQKVVVLVHDVQRDVLRHSLDRLCVRNFQQDGVPRLELEALGDAFAVAEHMTLRHEALQRTAGKAGVLPAEKAVDALACGLRLHDKFTLFHGLLLLRGLIFHFFQQDDQHPERHTDADEDVGEVEDCKVDEQGVDVVHDLTVQHTVDEVADAAGQHEDESDLLQELAAAAEEQQIGYEQQRSAGGEDKEELLSAQQAERHALIEHEAQLHHMRDDGDGLHRGQILGSPELDGLVDAHQRGHTDQIQNDVCHSFS